jgi:NitT/TauT family transport system substrate-binding protein
MPLINAHTRGVQLKLIAPGEIWLTEEPISGLVVLKTSTINTGRDLNGKTVSTAALRDLLELGTRAWVDQHGGDATSLRFIELPSSAVPAALTDGRIDAANLSNPNLAQVVASGKVRIIGRPDDAIAKRFLITGWFTTADFADQNRDAVARFARVVREAAAYTNTHHAETVPVIAPFWGIEPAILSNMERATAGAILNAREIQPMIDAAVRYKIIEQGFDARELISPYALTR